MFIQIPPTVTFCDDVVRSATIRIYETGNETHDYEYTIMDIKKKHTNNYFVNINNLLHWKPFYVSISVANRMGNGPYSDKYFVRGATNGKDVYIH